VPKPIVSAIVEPQEISALQEDRICERPEALSAAVPSDSARPELKPSCHCQHERVSCFLQEMKKE
jgi:hypothetical protein